MAKDKILIIGGYGAVGKMISAHLAPIFPNQIIVAGRDINKAKICTESIGCGAQSLSLDVHKIEVQLLPKDIRLVVMCLDVLHTDWLQYCVQHSIDYLDITANNQVIQNVTNFHTQAQSANIKMLLSVGLAPGLTNILTQNVVRKAANVPIRNVDIFVLLGIGEKHGDEAYRWTLQHLHHQYSLHPMEPLKSFTQAKKTNLAGKRSFYLFDFSDQYILSQKYPNINFKTRMAFDVKWLTEAVALMRRLGLTYIYQWKWMQNVMLRIFKNSKIGTPLYGVKVVALLEDGRVVYSSLTGQMQGRITAFVASLSVQKMMETHSKSGVLHIDELWNDGTQLLKSLQKLDADFSFEI